MDRARGDRGINQLDEACREHDIAYAQTKTTKVDALRTVLAEKAWERVNALDLGISERAYATPVPVSYTHLDVYKRQVF